MTPWAGRILTPWASFRGSWGVSAQIGRAKAWATGEERFDGVPHPGYDANGNLTAFGPQSFTWTDRRPARLNFASFRCEGDSFGRSVVEAVVGTGTQTAAGLGAGAACVLVLAPTTGPGVVGCAVSGSGVGFFARVPGGRLAEKAGDLWGWLRREFAEGISSLGPAGWG